MSGVQKSKWGLSLGPHFFKAIFSYRMAYLGTPLNFTPSPHFSDFARIACNSSYTVFDRDDRRLCKIAGCKLEASDWWIPMRLCHDINKYGVFTWKWWCQSQGRIQRGALGARAPPLGARGGARRAGKKMNEEIWLVDVCGDVSLFLIVSWTEPSPGFSKGGSTR